MVQSGKSPQKSPDTLIAAAMAGRPFNPKPADPADAWPRLVVDAPLIRALVLGLAKDESGETCRLTPAGIEIHHTTIEGRVELDKVVGADGGPVAPIEFHQCVLQGGFSGAHGQFAWLSFRNCTFRDPEPAAPTASADAPDAAIRADRNGEEEDEPGRRLPTINLSGAGVEGDLHMRGIKPEGDRDLLWICASNIRVDGEVDLSRCHLRAPRESRKRLTCEEADDALNLTLAEIKGDLQFLNGARSEGRIKLRAAHIEGDVWMSGAWFKARPGEEAIFFQGARIDGFLMMAGHWERSGDGGRYLEFQCAGELNLVAAEVGRDLHLINALVKGTIQASGVTVAEDFSFGAEVSGPVNLSGCRIGGTLDLSGLSLASSVKSFSLKDGNIGRSLKLVSTPGNYRLLAARSLALAPLHEAELLETLWYHQANTRRPSRPRDRVGKSAEEEELCDVMPLDHQLVQATFLRHGNAVIHLDGHGDVPARVTTWFRGGLKKKSMKVLEELLAKYSPGPRLPAEEPPALSTDGCNATGSAAQSQERHRFGGGLILQARQPEKQMADRVRQRAWLTRRRPEMDDLELDRTLKALRSYIQPKALIQGDIDLRNLSCDLLDDQAGRGWGAHLDPIQMNHFTYNRTTWEPRDLQGRTGLSTRPMKGFRARLREVRRVVLKKPVKSGAKAIARVLGKWRRHLSTRLQRFVAERLPVWAAWLFGYSDRLRVGEHWTPIERKRNWIYRQFDTRGFSSSSKYRIRSPQYRSQPFEQVVKVARAEGREDYALYFEILKERIEWDIFITRHRGWFALLGLFVGLLWWIFGERFTDEQVGLWAVPAFIIGFALLPSFANWVLYRGFGYLRRPVRAIRALIVAFLLGWLAVAVANEGGMLVIDVTPVASIVDEAAQAAASAGTALEEGTPPALPAPRGPNAEAIVYPVIGSQRIDPTLLVTNVRCGRTVNEALYALDVLIPLIDFREESRCEVGLARGVDPATRDFERLFFDEPTTFWKVLKALYAIAGWFIISLAILTFAHVTRPRAGL